MTDTPPQDAIAAAFEAARKASRKRGNKLPNLQQGTGGFKLRTAETDAVTVPGLPEVAGRPRRQAQRRTRVRTIPTGPDGRKIERRLDVDSIGSLLSREFSRRGWNRELANGWVTANWAELVGEKIAQHTTVEMVKETTLFISCDSTAWASNLRLMQKQILQAIAAKVGPNVITQLKIFGPRTPHNWRKGRLHIKGRGPRDTWG